MNIAIIAVESVAAILEAFQALVKFGAGGKTIHGFNEARQEHRAACYPEKQLCNSFFYPQGISRFFFRNVFLKFVKPHVRE